MYKLIKVSLIISLVLALYSCQKESVKARNTLIGRYSALMTYTNDLGTPPYTRVDTFEFTKDKKDKELIIYNTNIEMIYLDKDTFAFQGSGYWSLKVHIKDENQIDIHYKFSASSGFSDYGEGLGIRIP